MIITKYQDITSKLQQLQATRKATPTAPFDENPAALRGPAPGRQTEDETVAMGVFVPSGLAAGEMLSHYKIVERIGEGGMRTRDYR